MNSEYEIVVCTDTTIVIVDLDVGKSVTNDAPNVIRRLDDSLPGGIGKRKVFYRDSDKRYDEMVVSGGRFVRFAPCTEGQQQSLKQFSVEASNAL